MFAQPAYAATEGHAGVVYENGPIVISSELVTMWFVIAIIALICYFGTRNMKRIPHGLQNAIETVIELLLDQIEGVMDKERARRYAPFLMTLFILILFSNYSGLLPLSGYINGYKPPTSSLSVTAGLAAVTIAAFFFYGIRDNGKRFAKFFFGPMIPLNILDLVTRPLSLSVRLYGNVFGEEMVIAFLFSMIPFFLPLPMYALSLLLGAIQAYVFMLLASVYIEESTGGGH